MFVQSTERQKPDGQTWQKKNIWERGGGRRIGE